LLWLWLGLANAWWGADLRAVLDGEVLRFLPLGPSLYLVLGGMAVGSAGGLAAAWRAGSELR
jgi:hypothetical protein